MKDAERELLDSRHRQLIERIVSSRSFQKSERLKDLLRYLAEKTLSGAAQDLGEHRIGVDVFGKSENYSIVEDSSVRVHVRQLRLKLHEYFDGEGRDERQIVEIPKGAYAVLFRTVEGPDVAPLAPQKIHYWRQTLPWSLAILFLFTTFAAWFHKPATLQPTRPPWPLAALFDQKNQPVQVVVADVNYGIERLLNGEPATLDQYLSPSYRDENQPPGGQSTDRLRRLNVYLSGSLLTSYADVVVVASLMRLADDSRAQFTVRASRNLQPRELQEGSFVLVGSPSSNPWVFYFQNKLNFQELDTPMNADPPCFQNMHPAAGEPSRYCAQTFVGGSGETYATISLVPITGGQGSALILQGLHQEATEAAGDFLADADKRKQLQHALGISGVHSRPVYFEALISVQAIAGAPSATSIVDARVLHP
jgi:hypothetical protein